jgi:hypothetical protein
VGHEGVPGPEARETTPCQDWETRVELMGLEPTTPCLQKIIEQFLPVPTDDGWCLRARVSGLLADRANRADTAEHEPF